MTLRWLARHAMLRLGNNALRRKLYRERRYDKAGNALQDELDAVREAYHPELKICSIDFLEAFTRDAR